MDKDYHLHQQLATSLSHIILAHLRAEVELHHDVLREDVQQLSLEQEAQRIGSSMVANITTTIDVHLRHLLYPEQKERTAEWLRSQNYMHRREDENNRPTF